MLGALASKNQKQQKDNLEGIYSEATGLYHYHGCLGNGRPGKKFTH